jgi:hypothetical protein
MPARKVKYAPREVAGESRDPARWCKIGKHIPVTLHAGETMCRVCKQVIKSEDRKFSILNSQFSIA